MIDNKVSYQVHLARLLYIFTLLLIINVLWTTIQVVIFSTSNPSTWLNFNDLFQAFFYHTFFGQIARVHTLRFGFICGTYISTIILGWYLNVLYKREKKRQATWDKKTEIRATIYEERLTNRVLLVPTNELHRENFNLGDDKAAYFQYIISPIQDAYNTVTQTLSFISTDIQVAKHGILIIGEANAGKTRLAFEALSKVLAGWLVLQWSPDNSVDKIPTPVLLNEHNIVIVIDDLQKYVSTESIGTGTPLLINRERVETLHSLLKSVRESAKRLAIIVTCRIEDEIRVNSDFGDFFEKLEVIRLKRFNQDINNIEIARIIEEFKTAGAEHINDWDGTLGSLVLGLSRKVRLYYDLVQRNNPAAIILRAMKLLTEANINVHTEQRLKVVCADVFGEKELLRSEKAWRIAIKQLKQLQFVNTNKKESEITLIIRKDDYFEKVINDYSQTEIEQDFGKLQRVLVEIKDAEALTNLSNAYFMLNLYEDTLKALNQSLAINPNNAREWYLKGCILGILNQPEEALISFDKSLDINPRYSLAWSLKGVSFSTLKRPKDALLSFEEALSLNPDDASTWNSKGNTLLKLEKPQEALAAFEKGLALDPKGVDIWFNKGRALLILQQQHEEALIAFEQVLTLHPDHINAWIGKGLVLTILKQPQEALATFEEALTLDPRNVDSWKQKGKLLLELERQEEALNTFNQALAFDLNDAETLALKGHSLYLLGYHEEALTAFDRALALDPNNIKALNLKGHSLARLNRSEEALTTFDQALALDPNNAETLALKGHSLYLLELYKEALITINQALALDSNASDNWYIKGHIYFATKQFEDALVTFNQALKINPNYPDAWFLKGLTLELLERPEEGLIALEQSLTLKPNDLNALASKGSILFELKRYEEALAAFEKALALNPDDTEVRESKSKVLQMLHSETDANYIDK